MSAFDRIIGYESEKRQLKQIADALKNREAYERLGVSMPRGLLLHGAPGVGKTLMAQCLIEESGLKAFTCRKAESGERFLETLRSTFSQAGESAPSIVLLDDLDKFANNDEYHRDSEEFVTVQACIDESKGKGVFVLATANDTRRLPESVLREGRFDQKIRISIPEGDDAVKIVEHYFDGKMVSEGLDPVVVASLLEGMSCATLETVLNEAGLLAGYERKESIEMDHVVGACLKVAHGAGLAHAPEGEVDLSVPTLESRAVWHEAGHTVVSEILHPGSVTMVSSFVGASGGKSFVRFSRKENPGGLLLLEAGIMVALAGRAAIDERFGVVDEGCRGDLAKAFSMARNLQEDLGYSGLGLLYCERASEGQLGRTDATVELQLEGYYRKAKALLCANRAFFEKIAKALSKRDFLLASDIAAIREGCTLVNHLS